MKNGFSTPEIEQALISALMKWPDEGFPKIEACKIGEQNFTFPAHRVLFRACYELWKKGKPSDRALLIQFLKDRNLFNQAGKEFYINETWYERCHAPEMILHYIEILLDRELRKGLADVCVETIRSTSTGREASEILNEHEQTLGDLPKIATDRKSKDAIIDSLYEDNDPEVIETGITKLDRDSRLKECSMPLIAGERKAGKTTLALTIALNVAKQGQTVAYASLEESAKDIWEKLRNGLAHSMEIGPLIRARDELRNLPICVFDDLMTLAQIRAALTDLKQRKGLRLAIIDYAQLVRTPERETREQQVSDVSRSIKNLASQLHIPIILLCQLNEEKKTRESRALEQDCSAEWRVDLVEDEPNERFITIPFQRHGPSGIRFKVTFLGEISRIENYQQDEQ